MQLTRSVGGAALATLLTTSCGLFGAGGGGTPKASAPSAATTDPIKVVFETDARSNGCAALHVLVRQVKRTDFPRVEYADADGWLRDGSDDNTLDWLVLMPGEVCEREIRRPAGSDLALFFMFATPTVKWKWLITAEKRKLVRLAVTGKRACATSVISEQPRSGDAVRNPDLERKRCRSYAE